jgi:gamma-glutamylcyclotransferase
MPDPPYLWYFAYGSNMNPARLFDERMAGAGIGWGRRIAARLEGWQLAFNKPWSRFEGASVANIMPQLGAVVHGTLNEIEPDGLEVWIASRGLLAGIIAATLSP